MGLSWSKLGKDLGSVTDLLINRQLGHEVEDNKIVVKWLEQLQHNR